MQDVHLYSKQLGETPLEALLRFKREFPEFAEQKMTYAGRLDPLAEGVLLFLSGEKLHEKDAFLPLEKEYEAEFIAGISTDSLDLLGMVERWCADLSLEQFEQAVASLPSSLTLPLPLYSSPPVSGKPLFTFAKDDEFDLSRIPKREMRILDAQVVSSRVVLKSELFERVERVIPLVKGDFRQKEILARWREVAADLPEEFPLVRVRLVVSSGTYIRSLARYCGEQIGCGGALYSLRRTRIGGFLEN